MASFFSTTVGEQAEFNRILASAGLNRADVQRIIKQPTLAEGMVQALRKQVPAFPSWFVQTGYQRNMVYGLNKDADFGFMRADVPESPEVWAPPTPTSVMMLMPYRPDDRYWRRNGFQLTYAALLRWIQRSGESLVVSPGLESTVAPSRTGHVHLADGYAWEPGMRWVWFDPNAYQGMSPDMARQSAAIDGVRLAGLEVLMAMKLFPKWVDGWNGTTSPYPLLSGLQVDRSDDLPMVPRIELLREEKTLELQRVRTGVAHPHWASPTIREC